MFRSIAALTLLFTPMTGAAAAAGAMTASSISAPPGTPVRLRLSNSLSSRDSHAADRVEFRVDRDVSIGGAVAITKGSLAWGNVAEASPRGRMAHSGRLSVDIRGVCLADGRSAMLRGTNPQDMNPKDASVVHRRDRSDSQSAFAVPAWPILVFMLGKDVDVQAGTLVTAYLDAPVSLDPARLGGLPVTNCDAGAGKNTPAARDGAFVLIRSNPDGAEISVDGRFAGNTPSRLKLAPGDHRVSVALPGHEAWERSVSVASGDDLTVVAVLQASRSIAGSRDSSN